MIVVPPEFTFESLAAALSHLGWQRIPDRDPPPEIYAGEPDAAVWKRAGAEVRLTYTFHPAMYLRALVLEGADAWTHEATLQQQLPILEDQAIENLLRSGEPQSILLGLHASRVALTFGALEDIAELTSDDDELIRGEAIQTLTTLLDEATAAGMNVIAQWKLEHPDRSALFLIAGGARERKQLLRWLMHDQPSTNPHIDDVLRTALEDADWEVRATAIVAAVRLRARGVVQLIRCAPLPQTTSEGLNKPERAMLESIRQAAIDLLEREQADEPNEDPEPVSRAAMHVHLLRCVAGFPTRYFDRAALLVQSLATPLPADYPRPATLPEGVVEADFGYMLACDHSQLSWVAPVSHWLGDDLPRMKGGNVIRRETPHGFWIGATLVMQHDSEMPLPATWGEAHHWCRQRSSDIGLEVRLPTPDEWEMAARGPDGRRFPWGNNAARDAECSFSPWGVRDAAENLAQWTSEADGDRAVVCGGRKQLACAQRSWSDRQVTHGFRFLLEG